MGVGFGIILVISQKIIRAVLHRNSFQFNVVTVFSLRDELIEGQPDLIVKSNIFSQKKYGLEKF